MHLPGKPNTGDVVTVDAWRAERFAHGNAAGPPPIRRILLSPTYLWNGKGAMVFGSGSDYRSRLIDNQGTRAARPNINSQELDSPSSLA